MPRDQIVAFSIFAVAAAVTPGPSNVLVLATGARAGVVKGLPCLGGVVTGMALLMTAAALGLGGVIRAYPPSLTVLRWGGSAFLLWLAWRVAAAPPMSARPGAEPVGFWNALTFQWINPKSWIVCASAAGTFGAAGEASVFQRAIALGLIFAAAAAPSCGLWLVSGASMQRWLIDERRSRVFNVGMGLLLAGSVALVAL